jgi:hypothetical protein
LCVEESVVVGDFKFHGATATMKHDEHAIVAATIIVSFPTLSLFPFSFLFYLFLFYFSFPFSFSNHFFFKIRIVSAKH